MKVDVRRLSQGLRNVAQLRVVCLYGDDAELIHESARSLVAAIAGSADDPFRVTVCDGEQRDAVESALKSPPLSGGRAVVWARHVTERLAPVVARLLEEPDGAVLVAEYGSSTGRSKLRSLVEQADRGCSVACYAQAEAIRNDIRSALERWNVAAEDDVVALLAARAAATQRSGSQAGRLAALYAGRGGQLDITGATTLAGTLGSGSETGLGAAVGQGLSGDGAGLDAAVGAALEDGTAVAALRGALTQLQRLRTLALATRGGRSVSEAGRGLRPPLFFREEKSVAAALRNWDAEQLTAAARAVWAAERASKSSGVPQDAVCREVLAGLARRGAARRSNRSG